MTHNTFRSEIGVTVTGRAHSLSARFVGFANVAVPRGESSSASDSSSAS